MLSLRLSVVIIQLPVEISLFMVFDGHGGSHYAEDASKLLPPPIIAKIKELGHHNGKSYEGFNRWTRGQTLIESFMCSS